MGTSRYSILCTVFLLVGCGQYQKHQAKDDLFLKYKVDNYFQALTKIKKFNGVILVSDGRKTLLNKAYNLDESSKSTTFVTTQSQFDVHSISKTMARYLILKLEQNDLISQQDALSKYIPDFPNGEKITIKMLLEHSAGLPRELEHFKGNEIDLMPVELISLAKKQKLLFEPGQKKQYSNIGYQVIYFVISKIANKSFEDYLIENLFMPIGMNKSGAHFYTAKSNLEKLALNHEKNGEAIERVDNILEDEYKVARIYSTSKDLNRFLSQLKNDAFASSLANDSVIQHSGGSDGIRAHIYTNLETSKSFVLLANFDGMPFQKTIKDIITIIEGGNVEIPKELNRVATTLSMDILSRYEGYYVFSDMNNLELKFTANNNRLDVYQDNKKISTLSAENEDTFFDNPKEPESFEFIKNERGSYDLMMGWKGVKLKGVRK